MSAAPPALAAAAEARRKETVRRTANGIAKLQSDGEPVSLRRIAKAHNYPMRRRRLPQQRDKVLERKSKPELIDLIHQLGADKAHLTLCLRNLAFRDGDDDEP